MEVVSVHYNMVNNDYQEDSRALYTFIPNKMFLKLLDFSPKMCYIFERHLIQSFHILKYGLLIKILNHQT